MKTPLKSKPHLLLYICALTLILLLAFRNAPTSLAFIAFSVVMGLIFSTICASGQARFFVRVIIFKPVMMLHPAFFVIAWGQSLVLQSDLFFAPLVRDKFLWWIMTQYLCLVLLSFSVASFSWILWLKKAPRETNNATPS